VSTHDDEHDAHLRAALRHAPDHDVSAPALLGAQILGAARRAVQPPPAVSRVARLRAALAATFAMLTRPAGAAAFASVALATVIGVMWRDVTPPEVLPERRASPAVAPATPAAPPVPAPPAAEPSALAPATTAAPPAPPAPPTTAKAAPREPTRARTAPASPPEASGDAQLATPAPRADDATAANAQAKAKRQQPTLATPAREGDRSRDVQPSEAAGARTDAQAPQTAARAEARKAADAAAAPQAAARAAEPQVLGRTAAPSTPGRVAPAPAGQGSRTAEPRATDGATPAETAAAAPAPPAAPATASPRTSPSVASPPPLRSALAPQAADPLGPLLIELAPEAGRTATTHRWQRGSGPPLPHAPQAQAWLTELQRATQGAWHTRQRTTPAAADALEVRGERGLIGRIELTEGGVWWHSAAAPTVGWHAPLSGETLDRLRASLADWAGR
jgi:hypothetical protein